MEQSVDYSRAKTICIKLEEVWKEGIKEKKNKEDYRVFKCRETF